MSLRGDHSLRFGNSTYQKPGKPIQFSNEQFSIFQDLQEIHQKIDRGEIKIDNMLIDDNKECKGEKG